MDLEGCNCGLIEALSWYLPGGTEKNYEITLEDICCPSQDSNEHFQDTSLERCRYTIVFDD
jgi:hypothetical protein